MKYTLQIFCVLLILIFSNKLHAQLNYKKGIVISLQNDTLKGTIRDGGGIRNSKVCVFKPENNGKKIRYYPDDIKSYIFNGDKYYSSKSFLVKGEYKNVFSEVLLEGEYSLFFCYKNKQVRYAIQKKNEALIALPNYEKRLNTYYGSHTLSMRKGNYYSDYSFVDTLAALFKDSPKVMNVVKTTEYAEEALINLTKIYLKDKCKGVGCLLYEKNLRKSRIQYGLFSGAEMSQLSFLYSDYSPAVFYNVPLGVFVNIPIPQLSERLFFETDLILNSINLDRTWINYMDPYLYFIGFISVKSTNLDVPLLFKYEFTGNKLTPAIAIGKEFGINLKSKVVTDNYINQDFRQIQTGKLLCELSLNYDVSEYYSLFAKLRFKSRSEFNYGMYKPNVISLFVGVKF